MRSIRYDEINDIGFESIKIGSFVQGNYNVFANPGGFNKGERVSNWISFDDQSLKNAFYNTGNNFVDLFKVGSTGVNCAIDNNDLIPRLLKFSRCNL